MAAEAPEDTPSQILAPRLGHLPAYLPRRPGPTVRRMPGAGPLGGRRWAQASLPGACGVDSPPRPWCTRHASRTVLHDPARWVSSALTHRGSSRPAGSGLRVGCLLSKPCFSSASGLLPAGEEFSSGQRPASGDSCAPAPRDAAQHPGKTDTGRASQPQGAFHFPLGLRGGKKLPEV